MKKILAVLLIFALLIPMGITSSVYADAAKIKITDDYLRIRSSASTDSEVLGYVMAGEEYDYSTKQGVWYQITTNGKKGWVHGDYVQEIDENIMMVPVGTYTVESGDTLSAIGMKYGVRWQDIYDENNLYSTVLQIGQTLRIPGLKTDDSNPEESDNNQTGILKVTDNGLNVRSGPSTSYRIISQVNSGEKFEFVAKNSDWYKIVYNDQYGWIHGNYVKEQGPVSTENPQSKPTLTKKGSLMVTEDYLRVRYQASTSSKILAHMMKGKTLDYFDTNGKWYQVEYLKDKYGWIHGDYVKVQTQSSEDEPQSKPTLTKKGSLTVTEDYLRVRYQASTSSKILAHMMKGKTLDYFDTNGKWYQVEYLKDKYGWIHGDYVKLEQQPTPPPNDPIEEPSVQEKGILEITDDYLRIRSSASTTSKVLGYVMSGDQYDYYEVDGLWYKIEYKKDSFGWIHGAYAKKVENNSDDEPRINLLLSSKYVEENLPIQISVSVEAKRDQEIMVSFDGETIIQWGAETMYGYVNPEVGKHTVIVKTRDLGNNHAKVFTKSITFTLEEKSNEHSYQEAMYQMTLEEFARSQVGRSVTWKNGGWNSATYEEILAEIDPAKILEMKSELSPNKVPSRMIYIDTDILNVRKEASTDSAIITQVFQGERYTILESVPNWYKIRVGNQIGYVYAGYTNMDETKLSAAKELGKYVMIATDGLNFRTSPSLVGKIVAQLEKGYIYPVIQVGPSWTKIKVGDIEGYVSTNYIAATENVSDNMYQFLNLQGNTGVQASELNKVLEKKGILEGRGQAFVEASMKYNINEMYLISHALLETGNGLSTLATGVDVKDSTGKTVRVYNMYGIGAYDSNPITAGSLYALEQGWTDPDKAIIEGAQWIANNYINNDYKQNTLYKMKWNYENTAHQYATDIGWARKQTYNISNLYSMINGYKLKFIVPNYAK